MNNYGLLSNVLQGVDDTWARFTSPSLWGFELGYDGAKDASFIFLRRGWIKRFLGFGGCTAISLRGGFICITISSGGEDIGVASKFRTEMKM